MSNFELHYATDIRPDNQSRTGSSLTLPAGAEWLGCWEPVSVTCKPDGTFWILWRRPWAFSAPEPAGRVDQ